MLRIGSALANTRLTWRWHGPPWVSSPPFAISVTNATNPARIVQPAAAPFTRDIVRMLRTQSQSGSARFPPSLSASAAGAGAEAEARATTSSSSNSQRSKLRAITPSPKVLHHLDSLQLGYLARRKERVAVARRYETSPRGGSGSGSGTGRKGSNQRKADSAAGDGAAAPSSSSFSKTTKVPPEKHTGVIPLEARPYPFNTPGRPMSRIEHVSDMRTNLKTPEVAIIGRSNVGKSTLVNTLLGYDTSFKQKALVSEKPGETRSLHLFAMGGDKVSMAITSHGTQKGNSSSGSSGGGVSPGMHRAYTATSAGLGLTDMPGYGFAYMNEETRVRCEQLILGYLGSRGKSLKRVLLLIDARHGFKVADKQFLQGLVDYIADPHKFSSNETAKNLEKIAQEDMLDASVHWKLQIILTKCDLLERSELARRLELIKGEVEEIVPPRLRSELPVLPVSGLESKGTLALMKSLAALVPRNHEEQHKNTEKEAILVAKKMARAADAAEVDAMTAGGAMLEISPKTLPNKKGKLSKNSKNSSAAQVFLRDDERDYDAPVAPRPKTANANSPKTANANSHSNPHFSSGVDGGGGRSSFASRRGASLLGGADSDDAEWSDEEEEEGDGDGSWGNSRQTLQGKGKGKGKGKGTSSLRETAFPRALGKYAHANFSTDTSTGDSPGDSSGDTSGSRREGSKITRDSDYGEARPNNRERKAFRRVEREAEAKAAEASGVAHAVAAARAKAAAGGAKAPEEAAKEEKKKQHRWTDKKKLVTRDGVAAATAASTAAAAATAGATTSSGFGVNARLMSATLMKKTGIEKVKGMKRLARRAAERAAAATAAAAAAAQWGNSSSSSSERSERSERVQQVDKSSSSGSSGSSREHYTNASGEAPWWRRAKQPKQRGGGK